MPKLFSRLSLLARSITKSRLPLVYTLVAKAIDIRLLTTSWAARVSHVWGARVLLVVGLAASVYAVGMFVADQIGAHAPSPAHDAILRNRFASPPPSKQIVIVDVDERSLALLAPEHGRWPWPRNVMADGLQKISDLGARAVVFNVLVSDPDKGNADGDAALEITAQMVRPVAFPLTRLNPENDGASQLKVSQIPGASAGDADRTLAAILPMHAVTHDRLGVSNQATDEDGIVRQYALAWREPGITLPSLVGRALELGGAQVGHVPDRISLNWRNKRGDYQRISFGDLLQAEASDPRLAVLRDAWVVVGVSAPGLGPTKPTPARAVTDDNEILATALDDALSGTWLRVIPAWGTLLINLAAIWVLIALALGHLRQGVLTQAFVLAQSGFGAITLLSASYTHYLVDLSESMSFGVAVFGVIRIVQSLEAGWLRARRGMRRIDAGRQYHGTLAVIGLFRSDLAEGQVARLERSVEGVVGPSRLIRIDDLFGGESLIKANCDDILCLLALADEGQLREIETLIASEPWAGRARFTREALDTPWNADDPAFAQSLAPLVLESASELLRSRGGAGAAA